MKKFIICSLLLGLTSLFAADSTPSDKIDIIINKSAAAENIKLKTPVSDDAYIRRAYLDTVGRIPTIEEINKFKALGPNKRSMVLVELLKSEGHVQHFYHFWADLLRIRGGRLNDNSQVPGTTYVEWIKDQIRENVKYDDLVKTLLTSTGDIYTNPAVAYYLRDANMPLDNFSTTSQIFLGIDLSCAQCHDDPFQDWSQMDFYNMAAFFTPNDNMLALNEPLKKKVGEFNKVMQTEQNERERIRRELRAKPDDAELKGQLAALEAKIPTNVFNGIRNFIQPSFNLSIAVDPKNTLKLPHDYKYEDADPNSVVEARTVLGQEPGLMTEDLRVQFADWLTQPQHPSFTKNIVNRIWEYLMGSPLIPVMDNMYANEPINAELVKYLETLLVDSNYDLKRFQYWILNTKAYQRVAYEEADGKYIGQSPYARRLTATQIWDSYITLRLNNVDYYSPVSWDEYSVGSIDETELSVDAIRSVVETVAKLDQHLSTTAEKHGNLMLVRSSFINDSNRNRPNYDLLYKFGGSDRSLVNDSNEEGSVAQVLLLSNGPLLDMICDKKSKLMTDLEVSKDKIDYLWMSTLSRLPSLAEKNTAKTMDNKDIVWVLINSQEFRFTP